jgi:DNA-binding transcriptional MerR regulator
MSIGEFARRSRLSPKALRLYDGLGLLSPARVDELSGYRYYEGAQLGQARLIAVLRQAGVPLTTVKDLLALDPAEMAERVTAFSGGKPRSGTPGSGNLSPPPLTGSPEGALSCTRCSASPMTTAPPSPI